MLQLSPANLYGVFELLHVLVQKLAMEVISDSIIDEALGWFGLTTRLVLEHNVIVPPADNPNWIKFQTLKRIRKISTACVTIQNTLEETQLIKVTESEFSM